MAEKTNNQTQPSYFLEVPISLNLLMQSTPCLWIAPISALVNVWLQLRLSSLGQQHSQSLRSPESVNASIVYMYSERHEPGTNTSHFSGFQGVEYHHYTGKRGPGCFRLRCQASHAGTSLCELHWVSSKRRGENSLAPVCNKLHGVGWTSTSHLSVYRDLIQRNTSICHSSSNHALPRQTCPFLNI